VEVMHWAMQISVQMLVCGTRTLRRQRLAATNRIAELG
jgi:hypothetical protein